MQLQKLAINNDWVGCLKQPDLYLGFALLCGLLLILNLSGCQSADSLPQWRWQPAVTGLPRQAIILTAAADPTDPNRLWAGYYDSGGLATSLDGGQTWTTGAVGLDDSPIFDLLPLLGEDNEGILWAATRDGLLQSLNAGVSWQPAPGNLPNLAAFALAADATGRLYVGLDEKGVYAQTQDGQGWKSLNVPLERDKMGGPVAVISLAVSPDGQYIFAGTSGNGVLASNNGGQSWIATYPGQYAPEVAFNPNNPTLAVASLRERLVRTRDGGQSWHTLPLAPPYDEFVSLLWLADGLGVGTSQGRLYRSQDGGDTWLKGGDGLPPGGVLTLAVAGGQRLDASNRLLVGTWTGLYASDDGGRTLTYLTPSLGTPRSQTLLAIEAGLLLGTGGGLFRWQPDTRRWIAISDKLSSGVASLAANPLDNQMLYAGTLSDGVYRSRDGGVSWKKMPSIAAGIPDIAVDLTDPNHIYILAAWERVYASRNGGWNWDARWEGLGEVIETTCLAVDPFEPIAYVGTETGLYRSNDGGDWVMVAWDLAGHSILSLMVQPTRYLTGGNSVLYIGTTQGAYRSLDQGGTIEKSDGRGLVKWGRGLENLSITAFLAESNAPWQLYAGTAYAGVYQSLDGGQNWYPIGPSELANDVVESLAWGPNGELFVAAANGVWMGERQ